MEELKLSEKLEEILERVPHEIFYDDPKDYHLIDDMLLSEVVKVLKAYGR